jgi:hypothetical protein
MYIYCQSFVFHVQLKKNQTQSCAAKTMAVVYSDLDDYLDFREKLVEAMKR